ncbi:MAG: hypothetical protein GXN96_04610 [Aquificae bacterium]|nr:hypothetical protein [Aquificota bacterium]
MRFLRALFLSLVDAFREDFSYHASALTLQFLLVLAPMLIFFTAITSLTPFVNFQTIQEFIEREFPSQTHAVLKEIFKVKQYGKVASFLSLILSYLFSVNFVKKLSRSFTYVVGELHRKRGELFLSFFLPVLLVLLGLSVSLFFSVSLFLKVYMKGVFSFVPDLVSSLPVFLTVLVLYTSFVKVRSPKILLLAGGFVFLGVFLLQALFTLYTSYIFKGSLLYGSLSSIILFLLWLQANFLLILVGARLITRYESLS